MDIDDVGVNRLDRFILKAKPLDSCHADIVDEDIRLFEQRLQYLFVFSVLDIQVDGFFVAVKRGKNWAVLFGGRIPAVAHHIARRIALAVLDLDDLGAQVSHLHGGIRPKHDCRHVHHLDALQWPGWFLVPCQFRPFCHHCSPKVLASTASIFKRAVKRQSGVSDAQF